MGGDDQDPAYQCRERRLDGTPCGRPFSRLWNLQRHMRIQHQQGALGKAAGHTFVIVDPAAAQPRKRQAQPPAGDQNGDKGFRRIPVGSLLERSGDNLVGRDGDFETHTSRKRWDYRRNYAEVMPVYDIKRSSRVYEQEKGVAWLTYEAKQRLDRRVTHLMNSWGVAGEHSGTCILLTSEWEATSPDVLAQSFTPAACPRMAAPHVSHREGDYITLLARAQAWFSTSQWPRSGIQLDNLVECGPFIRYDGSHLCHNSLCVNPNHITWEPCHDNQGRTKCHDHALLLRRSRLPIPPACSKHEPPCLLQHAALTTLERVLLQIWVLRRSRGMPEGPAPPRPQWHTFPSFEYKLPVLSASGTSGSGLAVAVAVEPRHFHRPTGLHGRLDRPQLICPFCTGIKSFVRAFTYWGHLFHHHLDTPEASRLAEVRASAARWKQYLEASLKLSPSNPTARKVQQALGPGFEWHHVKEWDLRR